MEYIIGDILKDDRECRPKVRELIKTLRFRLLVPRVYLQERTMYESFQRIKY